MMNDRPVLIVTTMKDEGPYILEWVAHHLACGVDRFFVCTNDCQDGTDALLDRLAQMIDLVHVPNPRSLMGRRGNWQIMAQRYAALFPIYRSAGYIYFTDVDEVLQIHTGAGQLQDVFDAAGGFDVISFTSMPFGSGGVRHIDDAPVVQQFTVQSKPYDALRAAGRPAWNAIKTCFGNHVRFDVRRNHRPRCKAFSKSGHRWINGSGDPFDADWTDGRAKAVQPFDTTALAQFNHYAIRSAEAFVIKVARGDVANTSRLDLTQSLGYWRAYNAAGTIDTRAANRPAAAVATHRALLDDPVLADLHRQAVQWHKDRAAALRKTPEIATLWAQMVGVP